MILERTAIAIAIVVSIGAGTAAHAQMNSVLRQLSRTGLTQEDVNLMAEAGSGLYQSGNAVVGADTIWSNPATGAYGLVEVTSVEGECVGLIYKFRTRSKPTVQSASFRRCLQNGRWVLTP